MRILPAWLVVPVVALALFPYAARAQTPVDACDPAAPIQALSPDRHTGINLSESGRSGKIARIREAMTQSPDDLFLNRWLIELQPKPQTGSLAAAFQEKLARHQDDPRYMYLYGRALVGKDMPVRRKCLDGCGGITGVDGRLGPRGIRKQGKGHNGHA